LNTAVRAVPQPRKLTAAAMKRAAPTRRTLATSAVEADAHADGEERGTRKSEERSEKKRREG